MTPTLDPRQTGSKTELDDTDYRRIHRAWFGEDLVDSITDDVRHRLDVILGILPPSELAALGSKVEACAARRSAAAFETSVRVREIEERALRELRHPKRGGG